MHGVHPYRRPWTAACGGSAVRLELRTAAIDVAEPPETRIQRLISENPVVIFTRSACVMCHVMKKLLSTIGAHPAVIELDEVDIAALPAAAPPFLPPYGLVGFAQVASAAPALFIRGTRVGGLESLVALHLSGRLVPMLDEVGALLH